MCDEDPYLCPAHGTVPQIEVQTARKLVEDLYGLKVKRIHEVDGYIDKNYIVEVEQDESTNPHIPTVSKSGYVLKVLNSIDSRRPHVDAEHEVCRLLMKHGVQCPIPELNIHGTEKSLEKLPIETKQKKNELLTNSFHLVRLLLFIPGVRLLDVQCYPEILVQSGEQLGKIDHIIKDFNHPALENYKLLWNMTRLPEVLDLLLAITDLKKKKIIQDVIKSFHDDVEPNYDKYSKAVIQGDYSPFNIIVSSPNHQDHTEQHSPVHRVKGVVDFGHVIQNYRVMEVAIAIAYHSVGSNVVEPVDVGGYFLAGFYRHMQLNEAEKEALKTLVSGRICQSLVIGAYTHSQNPHHDYSITTAKNGWTALDMIWKTPKRELYSRWQNIVDTVNVGVIPM